MIDNAQLLYGVFNKPRGSGKSFFMNFQSIPRNHYRHKDDGPFLEIADIGNTERNWKNTIWYIHNVNMSDQIVPWLNEKKFPWHTEWTNRDKVLFKLRWC